MSVPFGERGGRLRGGLDLVAGRYPRFVFGGSLGHLLPIFHFHDESHADLEPKLQYLAENGYRTVSADDVGAFVRGGSHLPDRAVALCFDDAWASVWTVAGPLLAQHGMQAILYAIPGRTDDAPQPRPRSTTAQGAPFATWPELRALRDEGSFDVQSHTFSHAMVSTSTTRTGFVQPGYETSSFLGRPLVDREEPFIEAAPGTRTRPVFTSPADLGAPLYATRSRMSEAPRVWHSPTVRDACTAHVRANGGTAFFARPSWRSELEATAVAASPRIAIETEEQQQRAIEFELDAARSELTERLGARVNHVCLPWGVSGRQTAAALDRLGIATAVANRMPGMFAARPGDDPHWLKRLPNRYIYRLPGRGRRWWFLS